MAMLIYQMVTLFHWALPQENPIKHLSPWDEFL